jgi:hypothetical protein
MKRCKQCEAEIRREKYRLKQKVEGPTPAAVKRVHLRNYREWRQAFDEQNGGRVAGREPVSTGEREAWAAGEASAYAGGGLRRR